MSKAVNKREHRRIRLTPLFVEPIQIQVGDSDKLVPGIMADLSVAGVSIITYTHIPLGKNISLNFKLGGIDTGVIHGKVYKIREQSSTYMVVILFDDFQEKIAKDLENIAMDFEDCETKWVRGDFDFCSQDCAYYSYCTKIIKKEF
ncbi:MAG: PilZ domain-containing protein [bacterium]|nr:PilZ domain-containing protein [bacterium]